MKSFVRTSMLTSWVVCMALGAGCKTTPSPAVEAPPTPAVTADAAAPVDATPASPETPAVADAGTTPAAPVDAAPAPPPASVNRLQFRPGPQPPRGRLGAHGADVWSVVIGYAPQGSTELHALFQRATAAHLAASEGQPSCSMPVGASFPATVGTDDNALIVSVQFANERDARRFAEALVDPPLWIGRVHVTCAD